MKRIYFATRGENFAASTSLKEIAEFMDYSPDYMRRLMKGVDRVEVKTGVVYRAYLSTIEGRGSLQNFMR